MGSRVGDFLKESRIKEGLSQREVSQYLGYPTAQVISDWERGVRSPPSIMLKMLVKLYAVPMEQVFTLIMDEKTALLERKVRADLGLRRVGGG